MLKRSNKVEFFIIITNSKCFLFVIRWCLSDKNILMIYTKCDIMKQTIFFLLLENKKWERIFSDSIICYESTSTRAANQPNNQTTEMNEVENCLGGKHRPGMTINFLKKEFLKLPSVVQGIQRNNKKTKHYCLYHWFVHYIQSKYGWSVIICRQVKHQEKTLLKL